MRTSRRSRSSRTLIVATAAVMVVMAAAQAGAVNVAQSVVVSANPADGTPNVLDGQVNAVLQMGTKVVVGGTFTQVQRANSAVTLTRNYIFAFDMTTGVIDTAFVPQLTGLVNDLAPGPDGTSVFVGGAFNSVNGDTQYKKLVRLNLSNGQIVTGFRANPGAAVQHLVLRMPWLYVSGGFMAIRNVKQPALARVNPDTGVVDPTFNVLFSGPQNNGALNVRKFDVSPDGTRLVAIGNFSLVGGQPRNQVAVLDLTTSPVSVSSWQTDVYPFIDTATGLTWCISRFQSWMRAVDISPDGRYFVIVTTGGNRPTRMCDTAARWDLNATGPGQQPAWATFMNGDTSFGVSVSGTAVYIGGHMQWVDAPYTPVNCGRCPAPTVGGVPRKGIAALDPVNGLPFSWNPTRDRGVGTFALPTTADGLWVGSDTNVLGGETHDKLGFFPVLGGTAIPANVPYPLPGHLYRIDPATGGLTRQTFDGNVAGAPSTISTGWDTVRGAFALNGRLYTGSSDGTLRARSFDGTVAGSPSTLNLYGLQNAPDPLFHIPGTTFPIPGLAAQLSVMTGMFFDGGRVYYSVAGDPRLYARGFTPESQVLGANLYVASTGDGVDWANVAGMTMASGYLYFATTSGNLFKVAWLGGHPSGAVTQIGGPLIDGKNWSSRALFVFN